MDVERYMDESFIPVLMCKCCNFNLQISNILTFGQSMDLLSGPHSEMSAVIQAVSCLSTTVVSPSLFAVISTSREVLLSKTLDDIQTTYSFTVV